MQKVIIGGGGLVLLGFGIMEYSKRENKKYGFHFRDTDPNLRILEKDVIIPKYMRDYVRLEACVPEVEAFNACFRKEKPSVYNAIASSIKCRKESKIMLECQNNHFIDEDVYLLCKKRYLKERTLFRISKVNVKNRKAIQDLVLNGKDFPKNIEIDEDMRNYYNHVKKLYDESKDVFAYDHKLLKIFYEKQQAVDPVKVV